MDTSGTQLHPNWRALTTIHYPLKRFIQSSRLGGHEREQTTEQQHEIQGVNGPEAQQFYEETITTVTAPEETRKILAKRTRQQTIEAPVLLPFDKQKFFRFAMTNNVAELRKFIYTATEVNEQDSYGWTALMMAACEGAAEAIAFLLELGADRGATDNKGNSAKMLAMKKGHLHIVEMLSKTEEIKTEKKTKTRKVNTVIPAPFYCDICQRDFTDTSLKQHQTSTVHQFNAKSPLPPNKLQRFNIPPKNRGLQLMVKQGWDKESGLGPTQSGRLYPVKTVIRKQRSGLGIDQPPARVTHFEAFDLRATQRNGVYHAKQKARNRNDMKREKQREWKRERRLRNELS